MKATIRHIRTALLLVAIIALAGCDNPSVPDSYTTVNTPPTILPDYTNVTIPVNLCPTNFIVMEVGKKAVARISTGSVSAVYGGNGMKVCFDEDEWRALCESAKGGSLKVEVFVEGGGTWTAYKPFNIYVAPDSIDEYISYRLIQPGYVAYAGMSIVQRNLTNFNEKDIYNNSDLSDNKAGQCVNCHSYQNYHTDHMLMHLRQNFGGTIIVNGDKVYKVDTKTDETISAGVYPAWHPTQNLVVFSTDQTFQTFHTKSVAKVEVQDLESDLVIYDVDKNELRYVENDSNELEVFPTWSPDGKTLYYCSAHFVHNNPEDKAREIIERYKEVKYSIYAKDYDPKTHTFGPKRIVFDAAAHGQSATLPRVSPDGRHMVFALGDFGCFHVWHPEADIYLLTLTDGVRGETTDSIPLRLDSINSKRSESYPSFSSNGRWIMTASRRDDGNYTRPYISYFDSKGVCHKAFELPQKDPGTYFSLLRSFNRPEFMAEPVRISEKQFISAAKKEAKKVKFVK